MNIRENISNDRVASVAVPRNQFRKLWDWCVRNSPDGAVNVRVLRSSDYSVKCDRKAKRMGRAIPHVRVHPRFDLRSEKYIVGYSTISWSYVY